jgi:hypothetical protein
MTHIVSVEKTTTKVVRQTTKEIKSPYCSFFPMTDDENIFQSESNAVRMHQILKIRLFLIILRSVVLKKLCARVCVCV